MPDKKKRLLLPWHVLLAEDMRKIDGWMWHDEKFGTSGNNNNSENTNAVQESVQKCWNFLYYGGP